MTGITAALEREEADTIFILNSEDERDVWSDAYRVIILGAELRATARIMARHLNRGIPANHPAMRAISEAFDGQLGHGPGPDNALKAQIKKIGHDAWLSTKSAA